MMVEECPDHEEGEAINSYAKKKQRFEVANEGVASKIKAMTKKMSC